ncbi:hypothetical protein OS493_013576 [Desmophyllum pertusum]|uniref:Uncharacterized protein n=1 Tax=Desmophyllum pertusum TaxID=174260 RepID=A0A9X0D9E6_9CNID|nr:hypothetical protein OS493_013576 [Desmophyllum pertusum]
MSSEEREPRAKLNMEHGFIQSIIKNQVDRDDYDKEQKLMKVQNKISGSPSRRERPKRAALQVYVPPHLRGKTSTNTETSPPKASSTAEDWEVEKKPAIPTPEVAIQMKLEFVRKDGEVCELNISEGEDLKKVVTKFGRANGLDVRLRDALYHRLSTAMKGRAV